MSKIVVFMAQGLEESEFTVPVDMFRRAGDEVTLAAVGGELLVIGSHGLRILADIDAADLNLAEYDALFLPGGMPGTANLNADPVVCEAVKQFFAEGKLVTAICAAPSVLGSCGVLQGKKACCFPGWESELTGAQVVLDKPVVVDGNVVTGRGMGAAMPFALQVIACLHGRAAAEELAEKVVWMYKTPWK